VGDETSRVVTYFNRTRAEYFETVGLRILHGRIYTHAEIAARAPVALVSQSLARAYWHGLSPLGQMLPLEIGRITSVARRLQQEAGRPRILATLTGVVGIIAIALCVIGLYGLTATLVGQRAREMGVRVALGAAPRDLLRLLMWDSLRPVVLGLAVGAVTALLASRVVVAGMFFGVSPQDPMAFAAAVGSGNEMRRQSIGAREERWLSRDDGS
jgi:ABC-type antimicrobial peptide transport system permease subunit